MWNLPDKILATSLNGPIHRFVDRDMLMRFHPNLMPGHILSAMDDQEGPVSVPEEPMDVDPVGSGVPIPDPPAADAVELEEESASDSDPPDYRDDTATSSSLDSASDGRNTESDIPEPDSGSDIQEPDSESDNSDIYL